jgi:hypothetical protein
MVDTFIGRNSSQSLVIGTHAARSFYSVSKQITNLKLAHIAALEHDASTTQQWNVFPDRAWNNMGWDGYGIQSLYITGTQYPDARTTQQTQKILDPQDIHTYPDHNS